MLGTLSNTMTMHSQIDVSLASSLRPGRPRRPAARPRGLVAALAAAVALVGAFTLAGCDPTAKAQNNERAVNLSKRYESCASSMDCASGLRCFEQVCRSMDVSILGDYHAAVGARALAGGDVKRAIEAYTAAVNRYQSDKVPIPTWLRCAKGRALLGAQQDRAQAEAAALALHQCLREAPPGSSVRAQALADLAILDDSGLDPELLAREGDLDTYLTKKPAAPPLDKLKVTATGDARTRAKTYAGFLEELQGEAARGPLLACWEANWQSTGEEILSVTLPFRYRFVEGAYVEDDRDQLVGEGDEPAPGTAERCVYDAVSALGDTFTQGKRTGNRWSAKITVRIAE